MADSKSSDDHLLFIESDTKLQSTLSFVQYVINVSTTDIPKRRLVTLIGEAHNRAFTCGTDKETSITDYAINTLRDDKNSEVLLEIYPKLIGERPESWPHSVPIRGILGRVKGTSLEGRVKGYDWRWEFLREYRFSLYEESKQDELSRLTQSILVDKLIDPFIQGFSKQHFDLYKSLYSPSKLKFLERDYLKSIGDNFEAVRQKIISPKWNTMNASGYKLASWVPRYRKKVLGEIQDIWKQVTDWYILKDVLAYSSIDSVVVIAGHAHIKNLDDILKKSIRISHQMTGAAGNCVSLYRTLYVGAEREEEDEEVLKILADLAARQPDLQDPKHLTK